MLALCGLCAVICPFEGHPERTTAGDESSYDVKNKGKLQFVPSG